MKFIVLGAAGRMGSLHAKHLAELGHMTIMVDPKISDKNLDRWPSEKVDGIVIATPAEQHAADINTVLAAGIVKHIFIEKPICLINQLPGMRKMALDARMAGVSIHVGYNLRFHPAIMGLMGASELGQRKGTLSASFILRQVPKRPLKHFREEWASHEVDLAQYLCGEIQHAYACNYNPNLMYWQGVFMHKPGGFSSIHVDGYYEDNVRSVTLVDDVGHCFHRDIEGDHVEDSHYLDEISQWIKEIENPGGTGPGGALATVADGIAAINVFNWSGSL